MGVGVAAVLLSLPGVVHAQDGFDDAPFLFVDVSTGLRYEGNLVGDDEVSLDTELSAGFFSSTSNRRLSFETGFLLQTLNDQETITDPFLSVSYAIFNRETELSFDLDYSAVDLDDVALDDDFDAGDLTGDGGRRERLEAEFGLVTGRFAPFGSDTRLRYSQTTFSPGADDDDERLYSLTNTLFFRLNPQVTLRTNVFLSRTTEDDAANTEQTEIRYGAGADLSLDRAWTATLDISFTELGTEIDGALPGSRITTVVDGFGAAANVTREMPNGAYTFSVTRSIGDTGFQDTYRIGRTLELANGANIDGAIGVTSFEGADPILIYSLSYANEVLRGLQFNAAFDRSGGVSDDDENIIRTQLQAGLSRDLTPRSSVSFNTTFLDVQDFSLIGVDTARVDFELAYRHALTEDWNLAARVSRQTTFEDGNREDRVDVLSLSLERRFSFRP